MRKKKLAPGILSIQLLVLMSYSSVALLILLSVYFKHLGGSPRQIGFLLGIFSLSAFLSRPFVGWLLSKYKVCRIYKDFSWYWVFSFYSGSLIDRSLDNSRGGEGLCHRSRVHRFYASSLGCSFYGRRNY